MSSTPRSALLVSAMKPYPFGCNTVRPITALAACSLLPDASSTLSDTSLRFLQRYNQSLYSYGKHLFISRSHRSGERFPLFREECRLYIHHQNSLSHDVFLISENLAECCMNLHVESLSVICFRVSESSPDQLSSLPCLQWKNRCWLADRTSSFNIIQHLDSSCQIFSIFDFLY